jgi:hypothetical protein
MSHSAGLPSEIECRTTGSAEPAGTCTARNQHSPASRKVAGLVGGATPHCYIRATSLIRAAWIPHRRAADRACEGQPTKPKVTGSNPVGRAKESPAIAGFSASRVAERAVQTAGWATRRTTDQTDSYVSSLLIDWLEEAQDGRKVCACTRPSTMEAGQLYEGSSGSTLIWI